MRSDRTRFEEIRLDVPITENLSVGPFLQQILMAGQKISILGFGLNWSF